MTRVYFILILLVTLWLGGGSAGAQLVSSSHLTSADGASYDNFGTTVSMSGDTMAVGAPYKTINGHVYQGAVYLFTRTPAGWFQTGELIASDGAAGDDFGYSVSLNGNMLVVGAPNRTVGGAVSQGMVYVFQKSGGSWSQVQELAPFAGAANENFGCSVSLSGSLLAVGADGKPISGASRQGAVYLFKLGGIGWAQVDLLTASDGATNDQFGYSVSLNGAMLAVGAPTKTVNHAVWQGAVYIFRQNSSGWQQTQKLTASDGAAGDIFGVSVSLNAGALAIGAAHKAVGGAVWQGAAYIFTYQKSPYHKVFFWNQAQELTATDGAAYDTFGCSVSLNGNTLVVGAPTKTLDGNANQGAGYVFTFNSFFWTQASEQTSDALGEGDGFGQAVCTSGGVTAMTAPGIVVNGAPAQGEVYVVAVGSPPLGTSDGYFRHYYQSGLSISVSGSRMAVGANGAVYIFEKKGAGWSQTAVINALGEQKDDQFGAAVSLDGSTLVVGAPNAKVAANAKQGAVYVFIYSGGVWSQSQKLTASNGAVGDGFGAAVSLSGNSLIVGAPWRTVYNGQNRGAAYAFTKSGWTWGASQELIAADGAAQDIFGLSISVSGATAIIGAPGKTVGGNSGQGEAYVFTKFATGWTQTATLADWNGSANDGFGSSVSLNGAWIAIGAPFKVGHGGVASGAAYLFTLFDTLWIQEAIVANSDGGDGDEFGSSVALSGSTLIVGAPLHTVNGNQYQGAAYVFGSSIAGWTQTEELTAEDGASGDAFGSAVAVNGVGLFVTAPYNSDEIGAIYTSP